jgi:hypothetical protein
MKKLFLPLLLVAIFFAFYEQSKPNPNRYIIIISIAIFMFGMMQLMSKVPSKNEVEEEQDFDEKHEEEVTQSDYKIEEKNNKKED